MDLWSYEEAVLKSEAGVSRSPLRDGETNHFGGDWYVCIGGMAICTGPKGEYLAREIAKRWNHVANVCNHDFKNGMLLPEGGAKAICAKCGYVAKSTL